MLFSQGDLKEIATFSLMTRYVLKHDHGAITPSHYYYFYCCSHPLLPTTTPLHCAKAIEVQTHQTHQSHLGVFLFIPSTFLLSTASLRPGIHHRVTQ